jgi:hypothetical protein
MAETANFRSACLGIAMVALCSGSLLAQWPSMLDTELIEFICLENEKSAQHFR